MSELAVAPSRAKLIAAFAAVYTIWGSTYLAIHFAIETLPPFLMAGVRFLTAGGILYLWARLRGAPRPAAVHWRSALIIGGLLLLVGNGGVVWAEQRVTSGQAALLAGTVPLWMVLLEWLRPGGKRPSAATFAGLGVGVAGMLLLIGPGGSDGGLDLLGALALGLAAFTWAVGSLYARGARLPSSAALTTAIQMLAGGALLFTAGLFMGEWGGVELAALSTRSLLALLYLVVFGSLIGYSAYIYILGNASPASVSTYAYVNPVVAVVLGWALAGEELTVRMMVAAGIIVGSVVLLTLRPSRRDGLERQAAPGRKGKIRRRIRARRRAAAAHRDRAA
jgi:drug/metabolite transporter (DMT)-like permease